MKKTGRRRRMLEVLEQFRIIVQSIKRHYQDVERRAGLSGAQLWALAQVAETPGAKVGELARALAVHQSTASNLLRALEAQGLVTRERQGQDQRQVKLFASRKGLKLLRGAPRPLIGVLQQALSELPPSRLYALHAELAHVIALMRRKSVAAARALPLSEM
ncbi:MAG TPA: MarR family transcriptional regulator [Burkholderiales bacterium]|nr:MarR family transcriptional regulator [Burkholderiales bacterium]